MLIILVGIVSIFVCFQVYPLRTTADLIIFTTTVMGVVVSFSALIIAMQTYYSIDSVNVMTQMEGNVLENESYVISFTSMIRDFPMESSKEVSDAVFKKLERKFKKESRTAKEFSLSLQYFIDLIVIFPYLFKTSDETVKRMDRLLKIIDKKKNRLLMINSGNVILIDETVKLIKSIINYQQLSPSKENMKSTILDVRGKMLKNPVTQTVYYNYLGLYYNAKAQNVLRKKNGVEGLDIFSIDGLKRIKELIDDFTDEEQELYIIYLQEANINFHYALENGKTDVMWDGFIQYNNARTTYLLQLVHSTTGDSTWQKKLDEALVSRHRITILVKDTLENQTGSHLQRSFEFEKLLTSIIRINILIAEQEEIKDLFSSETYIAPTYQGLLQSPIMKNIYTGQFKKIGTYQNAITSLYSTRG